MADDEPLREEALRRQSRGRAAAKKEAKKREEARKKPNIVTPLRTYLAERGESQASFAASLNVTPSYVSQVMSGSVTPSGQWLNLVADTLNLSKRERAKLNRAGAEDAGYALDLSEEDSDK